MKFSLHLYLMLFSVSLFASADFNKDIKPLLDKYCVSCHGPDKQKANLRMDKLNPDLINGHDADMWQEVLDLVNISEMPPEKSKVQPTRAERQQIVEWLTASMRKALESERSTGGRNVMRRLTTYEYNNTLRDLLGLDLQFTEELPPEAAAKEGFKNNNTVLTTSSLHLEYFAEIGRKALEKVVLIPERKPSPVVIRIEPETLTLKIKKSKKNKKSKEPEKEVKVLAGQQYSGTIRHGEGKSRDFIQLNNVEIAKGKGILLSGEIKTQIKPTKHKFLTTKGKPDLTFMLSKKPLDGPITIRIKASAVKGKNGTYPQLACEIGDPTSYRTGGTVNVKAVGNPEIYEFTVRPENFTLYGRKQFIKITNSFGIGTSKWAYEDLPKIFIDSVEVIFNDYKEWPPAQHKAILIDSENSQNEKVYIREILSNFMKKAYRRGVSGDEVEVYAGLFEKLRPKEASFEISVVSTLSAVLCSSHFLMHVEPNSGENKRRINDYELATRLSYFIWSSMPDETLFSLAAKKQLHKPEVLQSQIRRMIKDPKSKQFARHFAIQWLDLEGMRKVAVNPEYFRFNEKSKDTFEEESVKFVEEVFKRNLSLDNFIDSEFAVLSPEMARHYGIPGLAGAGFTPVKLSREHHRGGVLTHASVLLGNSNGGDTHPIRRGKWLLERILNDPPPPPPPAVPELPEEEEGKGQVLSLKEKLAKHAKVESCNDCHSKIDPWGVAFENYNALGQWREGSKDWNVRGAHSRVAVDPSTQLKNGFKVKNLEDLKAYILNEKKDQFVKALVDKVLSYGIGRYTDFTDRPAIERIAKEVEEENFKFQTLIEKVVLSEPFLTK